MVAGLFGSTLERHGERIGYVGVSGFEQTEAVVGADRAGHVQRVSMGTVGTFARRAIQLWAATDVLVARFPNDASGLAALDGVLRDRRPDDLILIVRAPPAGRLRLLPSGMLGPGARVVAKHFWRDRPPARIGLLASERERRFGETGLTFYRKLEADDPVEAEDRLDDQGRKEGE